MVSVLAAIYVFRLDMPRTLSQINTGKTFSRNRYWSCAIPLLEDAWSWPLRSTVPFMSQASVSGAKLQPYMWTRKRSYVRHTATWLSTISISANVCTRSHTTIRIVCMVVRVDRTYKVFMNLSVSSAFLFFWGQTNTCTKIMVICLFNSRNPNTWRTVPEVCPVP